MRVSAEAPVIVGQISQFLKSRHGEVGRKLMMNVEGGHVVLRGQADSYYQKQLWLHGALQVAGAGSIVDEIEVSHVQANDCEF